MLNINTVHRPQCGPEWKVLLCCTLLFSVSCSPNAHQRNQTHSLADLAEIVRSGDELRVPMYDLHDRYRAANDGLLGPVERMVSLHIRVTPVTAAINGRANRIIFTVAPELRINATGAGCEVAAERSEPRKSFIDRLIDGTRYSTEAWTYMLVVVFADSQKVKKEYGEIHIQVVVTADGEVDYGRAYATWHGKGAGAFVSTPPAPRNGLFPAVQGY